MKKRTIITIVVLLALLAIAVACVLLFSKQDVQLENNDQAGSTNPSSSTPINIWNPQSTGNAGTTAPAGVCKDGHTEVILPAVAASCTETGLTEGKYCSVCNAVIVEQQVVNKTEHTVVVVPEQPATCNSTGLTRGSHCSVCNQVLEKQTVVDKLAHQEVKDPAVAATCTSDGLTEGSHCSNCGAVLRGQTALSALGHSYSNWSTTQNATCSQEGRQTRSCSRCGDTQNESIPAKGHQYANGRCTVCGEAQPANTNLKFSLSKDGNAYVCDGWSSYRSSETVIIPAYYNGKPVIGISDYAFMSYGGKLKTVILPEGLQFIECGAFYLSSITSIVIPDSVTKIDSQAFLECGLLEKVYINTTGWKTRAGEAVDFSDPYEAANILRDGSYVYYYTR